MNEIHWSPGVKIDHVEKQIIIKALAFYGNDREVTARSLGISRRTLDTRIMDYRKEDQKIPDDIINRKRVEMGLGAIIPDLLLSQTKKEK